MKAIRLFAALLPITLAGCLATTHPAVDVREPTTVRPGGKAAATMAAAQKQSDGSIFQAASFRGLFEDRRARLVGDVVTIQIQENTSAKRSASSTVDRTGSVAGSIGALPFISAATVGKLGVSGTSTNSFEGKGDTASDNTFTGTITVTVIEVLGNGNLVVAGEKQVGINQNVEKLRFSGVVNPALLLPGNVIASTQVADARVEVRGAGDMDKAQSMGWLSRFFLSWLPI